MAGATGAAPLAQPATIGRLWTSLPEVTSLLPSPDGPAPLWLVPDGGGGKLFAKERVFAAVVGFDAEPEALPGHVTEHFPATKGVRLHQPPGLPRPLQHQTSYGPGIHVFWPAIEETVQGHWRVLERVGPEGAGFEPRWLRPAIGGVTLTSLMTWWALLFGLSMLARYEPAGWSEALALDRSEIAAPLERLLDIALDRVPELVLNALLAA